MRKRAVAGIGLVSVLLAASALAQAPKRYEVGKDIGKDIVYNPSKGNCLACHGFPTLPDAEQTGNSGPPLIAMQARFPQKALLRSKIWDATASSPTSFMPPFGKHKVLSDDEIDKVVDFIYSL